MSDDYIPDGEKTQSELSPQPPISHHIPPALRIYPQWVCWTYALNEAGALCRVPVSQMASLDETKQRCLDEWLGLGFVLTENDIFVAVHLLDYFDKASNKIKILASEVMSLLDTYAEIDDTADGLHLITMAKGETNIKGDGIEVWTQDYMIPITGDKIGIESEARPRQSELRYIVETFCVQTWLQRVERMQGSGTEQEVLAHVLKDCLNTPGWLQDADRTGLFPFLGKCWSTLALRRMIRLQFKADDQYMTAKMRADIEAEIESYMPKKEKTESVETPDAGDDLDSMLQYDAKGQKVLENFFNMSMILEHHDEWKGRIRFDEFRNLATLDAKPVNDETEYRISEWLGAHYIFGGNRRQLLSDAIKSVATKSKYDALIEWIDVLPEWDGIPRMESWMIDMCGAEESDYSRWVGKVTLLQMMNRALNPGCIARLVPIWNGEENQGKSTAIALLGGEWATTLKVSLENKEAHMAIHGYWLAELEELDTLYKTSEARLKAFLTNTSDHYVPKYANHSVDYPRRTVFIGTTNDSDYLRGLTGNTRFLPINTGTFDLDAIKDERKQIFAEAKEWLLHNPNVYWWEEPEGIRTTVKEQRESRRVANVYEDSLGDFLDGRGHYKRLETTTWEEICTHYFSFQSKQEWKDKSLQAQVTDALKALGWYRTRSDGKSYWNRPGTDLAANEVPF